MLLLAGNFAIRERVNSPCFCYNPVVWQERILIKCCLRAVWTYLGNRQLWSTLTLHLSDQNCVCQSGPLWSHIKDRQEEDWKHMGQARVGRERGKQRLSIASSGQNSTSRVPWAHKSVKQMQRAERAECGFKWSLQRADRVKENMQTMAWHLPLGQLLRVLCLSVYLLNVYAIQCLALRQQLKHDCLKMTWLILNFWYVHDWHVSVYRGL